MGMQCLCGLNECVNLPYFASYGPALNTQSFFKIHIVSFDVAHHSNCRPLTQFTSDSSVLYIRAVRHAHRICRAVSQSLLVASAHHIVQVYGSN